MAKEVNDPSPILQYLICDAATHSESLYRVRELTDTQLRIEYKNTHDCISEYEIIYKMPITNVHKYEIKSKLGTLVSPDAESRARQLYEDNFLPLCFKDLTITRNGPFRILPTGLLS